MSKINRIINAAIGATMDRKVIYKAAKGKLPEESLNYSRILVDISGPKANSIKESLVRWKKAFDSNLERNKLIEQINAPFKHESKIITFIKNTTKTIKNKIS